MFKKILINLQIAALLASNTVSAGLPPSTLGGVGGTAKTTFNFKTPANQSTQISGVTSLIETGNQNRIANPGLEGAVNFTAYADAAAASPVDGTAGSPTITCTRTTTTPIEGSGSLLITKDAANRQGEGCSASFTIARADLAKAITVSFDYEVKSGTYDAGSDTTDPDLTAWVYGPTDGTPVLTQLAPYKVLGATTGTLMRFNGQMQTASSGVAYRLILHEAKTGTSAYTAALDNFYAGPTYRSYGAVQTDWVAWTPTGGWVSNSTYTGFKRRNGDSAEYIVKVATSGAPTSANLTVNQPAGEVIDTAKLVTTAAAAMPLGKTATNDSDSTFYSGDVMYSSTTAVLALTYNSAGTYSTQATNTQAVPITFGAGDSVVLSWRVPIVGWSSNVQVSGDAETKVVAAYMYLSSDVTTIAPNAGDYKIPFDVTTATTLGRGYDTNGAWDATNKRYVAPVAGKYRATTFLNFSGTNVLNNIYAAVFYVNGSSAARVDMKTVAASAAFGLTGSLELNLSAGDYVEVYLTGVGNNGTNKLTISSGAGLSNFLMSRISGPAQIAASESVSARYTNTAGTTLTKSARTTVPFATKDFDTHGAFATDTFTAPMAGKYRVTATILLAAGATWASGDIIILALQKNGTDHTVFQGPVFFGTQATGMSAIVTGIVNCVQGDLLKIQAQPNKAAAGNLTLDTTAGYNIITVERVGN